MKDGFSWVDNSDDYGVWGSLLLGPNGVYARIYRQETLKDWNGIVNSVPNHLNPPVFRCNDFYKVKEECEKYVFENI